MAFVSTQSRLWGWSNPFRIQRFITAAISLSTFRAARIRKEPKLSRIKSWILDQDSLSNNHPVSRVSHYLATPVLFSGPNTRSKMGYFNSPQARIRPWGCSATSTIALSTSKCKLKSVGGIQVCGILFQYRNSVTGWTAKSNISVRQQLLFFISILSGALRIWTAFRKKTMNSSGFASP